ncbi:MAG: NAD-dependent protein deacylase [Clostridiales bacterium]|jgi:NAD-dependent deacetylase|nr:NAD-dependent protein deacylase [Clostridiales bacterium]
MANNVSEQISQLSDLITHSGSTVFFGGAGVSTESGIPDFRSASGLYAAQKVYGYPPETLLSHTLFLREPRLFFRYYKENLICKDAKPNKAHLALAEFERRGRLTAVVTQNVDGLHQAAGSRRVYELHGSNHRQYCMDCGAKYDLAYILDESHCKDGLIPVCGECGGTVRPDVVLYEEGLDEQVTAASAEVIGGAELLIVGGTSLAVYPAAGLLRYFSGENLVLINKTKTHFDDRAKLVIRAPIGEVLGQIS